MSRWVFVGAAVVGLLLLAALAGSPALHSAGDSECPGLEDATDGTEPASSPSEADMGDDNGDVYADCPINDGAEMGAQGV
ncbi:hypothetical protein [Natronorubrum sp. DTA28]|uniref:hypothetical protein n=1 Tax=Natronorubrum sp. DTA28 TaxID=3447019 RepID=UPI003F8493B8